MDESTPENSGEDSMNLSMFGGIAATDTVPTPAIFSRRVERLAHDQGIGYIEACLQVCNDQGFDPEDIAKLINQSLKEKIHVEAMNRNYMKKVATLPI